MQTTAFDDFLFRRGFADRQLNCKACLMQFTFSASEQSFFEHKGLKNEPKRCPNCRVVARAKRKGQEPVRVSELRCADCQAVACVPFEPKRGEPVFCHQCFHGKKEQRQESWLVG